jgi:delta8-fatty-acid desaturase
MGAGRGERVREVSCEELATHASRDNCWIGIAGRVRGGMCRRRTAGACLRFRSCRPAPRAEAHALAAAQVYNVTRWIESHPGGQLPLLSLAGRDATDAFASFHAGWVAEKRLAAFQVGVAAPPPPAKTRVAAAPSADEDFRALKTQLEREGLFAPTYGFYALEALRCAALFALVLACTRSTHAVLRMAGAVALGIFWQQAAFVGHDAGHGGISGRRGVDSAIGLLCGNALTGIEIGWWQSTHNVHHLVPNSVEHDADVQHLPFMAVSEAFLGGIHSFYHNDAMACPPGVLRLLSRQHLYFFPILTVARYGLLLQGVKTVGWEWGKRHTGFGTPDARWTRPLEAAALAVFYAYAAWLLTRLPTAAERLLFTYLSGATFAILHLQARVLRACVCARVLLGVRARCCLRPVSSRAHARSSATRPQINLSHWSQRVLSGRPPGGWVDTQLAATLNWSCPPWLDWYAPCAHRASDTCRDGKASGALTPPHMMFACAVLCVLLPRFHGGLQFQIEHHLFPRLPRANFRKARGPRLPSHHALLAPFLVASPHSSRPLPPSTHCEQVAPRVRALCAKHGIPYRQLHFLEATREVVGTLRTVAHAARRKLDKLA